MEKNNWVDTTRKFDQWWNRCEGTKLIVADVAVSFPSCRSIDEYSDYRMNLQRHLEFFQNKSYHGEAYPDIAPYLGPGSLSTFIGAKPIYSNKTIWFRETSDDLKDIIDRCKRLQKPGKADSSDEFKWYRWTMDSAKFYVKEASGRYKPSMPDLEQNLDILSAAMGPERLLLEIIDNPALVHEALSYLYDVWEDAFMKISDIIMDNDGYTAYTSYNIMGKGRTSVLQSDISCMLSREMFREFELPYLRKQCEKLDNVIYHLDGPGAIRHLDDILSIDKINAVQWVPGSGQPGNADPMYYDMYDKIAGAGKGLYVYLHPHEIEGFFERFSKCRILVRTSVDSKDGQLELVRKYS